MKTKALNLYACLGGNRLLWEDCEVTAIELDPELARMYQERFPNDKVIVTDAHQYLLDHYTEFDFIWSSPPSPPCPTHSRVRQNKVLSGHYVAKYPEMSLYQEIIFLDKHYKGKWVVENVVPYYTPLIPAKKAGRHLFWSNFIITNATEIKDKPLIAKATMGELCEWHKIDLSSYKGRQRKDKIARNLVHYDTGLHIFNLAGWIIKKENVSQTTLEL